MVYKFVNDILKNERAIMSYYLVPVTNLILAQTIIIGDVVIIPPYKQEQIIECKMTHPEIHSIINSNSEYFTHAGEHLINVAFLQSNDTSPTEQYCESVLYIVDRALDFFRINYCRLDIRETLIGLPGITSNKRYIHFFDSSSKTLNEVTLVQYLYSQQPGIGLDIDYLTDYKSDPTYQLLNSHRTDEVYKEYRTILARACYAYHITDLNRCFCYLFSTVERMGNQFYSRFQDRKKKIIAYISHDQKEYDVLSNQFYFYSKKVRTDIIHKGISITDILPLEKINELLQNLFILINRFCSKVILSGIFTYVDLENELLSKINCFYYSEPTLDNDTSTHISNLFDGGEHVFFAEISNFQIDKTLKQGNVIFLPKMSIKNFRNYYWSYVYLDIMEENNLNQSDFPTIEYGKAELSLSSEFTNFTAYDLDIILNTIKLPEVQDINKNSAVAIILNEPFLNDPTWDSLSYFTFADIICSKINHGLDYIILSTLNIRDRQLLPSLSGIKSQIRAAYMLDDIENIIYPIPGRVFSQYYDYLSLRIDERFTIKDNILYNTIFNSRMDEIALLCKNALQRICDCYYISDYTIQISYMFDILDMLDPEDTEGNNLKTFVLPFIAVNKSDYHARCAEFKRIRKKFRNPLVHHGKNIFDLTNNQNEIFELFTLLETITVSYCTRIFSMNILTFAELEGEREKIKNILKI